MNGEKTVLVTGATGFIGSRIVDKILEDSKQFVVALSRNKWKLDELFSEYEKTGRFQSISQDVCEPFDLSALAKKIHRPSIDAVFHAACPISGEVIRNRPMDIISPNLIASQNLMKALMVQRDRTGVNGRIVLFSGGIVYGNGSSLEDDAAIIETDTVHALPIDDPLAPYAESKRMMEVMAKSYVRQNGIDAVIVRPAYVYGSTRFAPNTATFEFIRRAILRQNIIIKNVDQSKRDNIYIDDAINGIFRVYECGISGEAYNVSSGGELENFAAIDEIAEIIASESNKNSTDQIEVVYAGDHSGIRPPGLRFSNEKLKALGWQLETTIREGMRRFLKESDRTVTIGLQ